MAKGGYQRRRIEAKKAQERAARKRAKQRRLIMSWLVGVVLVGLIGSVLLVALTGDDEGDLSADDEQSECPGGPKDQFDSAPPMTIERAKKYTATLQTSKGTLEVELFDDDAPKTVNNFVFLAREKFYDNTLFHRVAPGFGGPGSDMVQGGDATACDGSGEVGYTFEDENIVQMSEPGLLAMANKGPATNGSQFFLSSGPVPHLNQPGACPGRGCHSVFGKVTEGMEVIGAIANSPRVGERPNTPVILESVTITES